MKGRKRPAPALHSRGVVKPVIPKATITGKGRQPATIVEDRRKESASAGEGNAIEYDPKLEGYFIVPSDFLWQDLRDTSEYPRYVSAFSGDMQPVWSTFSGISFANYVDAFAMLCGGFRLAGLALFDDTPHRRDRVDLGLTIEVCGSGTVVNTGIRDIHAGDLIVVLPPHPSLVGKAINSDKSGQTTYKAGMLPGSKYGIPVSLREAELRPKNVVRSAIMTDLLNTDADRPTGGEEFQSVFQTDSGGSIEVAGAATRLSLTALVARVIASLVQRGHLAMPAENTYADDRADNIAAVGNTPPELAAVVRRTAEMLGMLNIDNRAPFAEDRRRAARTAKKALLNHVKPDVGYMGLDKAPGIRDPLTSEVRRVFDKPLDAMLEALQGILDMRQNVIAGRAVTGAEAGQEFIIALHCQ